MESAPSLTTGTVLLMSSSLLYIQLEVNGQPMRALVDSGDSVSIIKKNKAKPEHIFPCKRILVRAMTGTNMNTVNGYLLN